MRSDRDKLVDVNERMTALVRKGSVSRGALRPARAWRILGWDKTVSTVAFTGGLSGYYDEMKAQIGK